MTFKRTLQAAITRGAEGVTVYCRSCAHSKKFTAADALDRWGTDASFPEIARRSKCGKCGKPAFEAAPNWPTRTGAGGPPMTQVPVDW
jgi:hypothetical protein